MSAVYSGGASELGTAIGDTVRCVALDWVSPMPPMKPLPGL